MFLSFISGAFEFHHIISFSFGDKHLMRHYVQYLLVFPKDIVDCSTKILKNKKTQEIKFLEDAASAKFYSILVCIYLSGSETKAKHCS